MKSSRIYSPIYTGLISITGAIAIGGAMYHNWGVSKEKDHTPIHIRGIEEKLDTVILEDGRRVKFYTQNNELKVEEIK